MEVLGLTYDSIFDAVDEAVTWSNVQQALLDEGVKKDYGYFTLAISDKDFANKIIMVCEIGLCPSGKSAKYFQFSQEKALRLASQPSHVSSWQSRNPERSQWGGAIRVADGRFIMSFSGLPELADEAVMLWAARNLGWLNGAEEKVIAKISSNKYVPL